MTFHAAVLEELNQPLQLRILRAVKPDVGQVAVRVHYSGICGKQLVEISGKQGPDPHLPHCLGHEGGGIVEAIGPGVTRVKAGDRVVLHWRPASGIEAAFPSYFCDYPDTEHPERNAFHRYVGDKDESVIGRVGAGKVTTFQEYAVVSENRVTKVPDDTDLRVAALLGCAVTTGLGVVINEARIRPGASVIILGLGGVGLNIVQGCRLVNATPVVGLDLDDHKVAHAEKYGLSGGFAGRGKSASEIREAMLDLSGGPADYVIDTTGHPHMLDVAFDLCRTGGTVWMVGQAVQGHRVSVATGPMHSGKQLAFSAGGSTDPETDIPRYLRLHKKGLIGILDLVTRTGKLNEVNTIIDEIRSGAAGRTLLDMTALLD